MSANSNDTIHSSQQGFNSQIEEIRLELQQEKSALNGNLDRFRVKKVVSEDSLNIDNGVINHQKINIKIDSKISEIDHKNGALINDLSRLKEEKESAGYYTQLRNLLIADPIDKKIEDLNLTLEKNQKEIQNLKSLQKIFKYQKLRVIFGQFSSNNETKLTLQGINEIQDEISEILNNFSKDASLVQIKQYAKEFVSILSEFSHNKLLDNGLEALKEISYHESLNAFQKIDEYVEVIHYIVDVDKHYGNELPKNYGLRIIKFIQDQVEKTFSENILEKLNKVENNNKIDSPQKLQEYFNLLKEIQDIRQKSKENGLDGLLECSLRMINSIEMKIEEELVSRVPPISFKEIISHDKAYYNKDLELTKSIHQVLSSNKKSMINEKFISLNKEVEEKLNIYQNFNDVNKKMAENLKPYATNPNNKRFPWPPIVKAYEKEHESMSVLKTMRTKSRENDVEFLQKVIDMVEKDQNLLPLAKSSIVLGALNHLEQNLKSDHFTVGVNKLKTMVEKIKKGETPYPTLIDRSDPNLYVVMEQESQKQLKDFMLKYQLEFQKYHLAQKIFLTNNSLKMHQFSKHADKTNVSRNNKSEIFKRLFLSKKK